MQTRRSDRCVPPEAGRAAVACLDRSTQRQGLVANERQPSGNGGYDAGMVRLAGSCKFGPAIWTVEQLKETAGYAEYVRWCGRTGAARPPPTRFLMEPGGRNEFDHGFHG